jgi:hypothetical protein
MWGDGCLGGELRTKKGKKELALPRGRTTEIS